MVRGYSLIYVVYGVKKTRCAIWLSLGLQLAKVLDLREWRVAQEVWTRDRNQGIYLGKSYSCVGRFEKIALLLLKIMAMAY